MLCCCVLIRTLALARLSCFTVYIRHNDALYRYRLACMLYATIVDDGWRQQMTTLLSFFSTAPYLVTSPSAECSYNRTLLLECKVIFFVLFSRPYLRSRYWYSVASIVVVVVTLCIVAKRCILEQKLLLRAYRKSYIRNRLVPK